MFGFPKTAYTKYKQNFLKSVIYQIEFDRCTDIKSQEEDIRELFADQFPRFNAGEGKGFGIILDSKSANFQEFNGRYSINMKSKDGQRVVNVDETSLNFAIAGSSYTSFKELIVDIKNFIRILEICQIKEINKLAIRKINIVEFRNEGTPIEILNFFLNPNIVNINTLPNIEHINHSIQSINYKNEDDYLNIKYGMNLPPINTEIGQLIIDIGLFTQKPLSPSKIIDTSELINSEIFNIFNWIINDDAKAILNE